MPCSKSNEGCVLGSGYFNLQVKVIVRGFVPELGKWSNSCGQMVNLCPLLSSADCRTCWYLLPGAFGGVCSNCFARTVHVRGCGHHHTPNALLLAFSDVENSYGKCHFTTDAKVSISGYRSSYRMPYPYAYPLPVVTITFGKGVWLGWSTSRAVNLTSRALDLHKTYPGRPSHYHHYTHFKP